MISARRANAKVWTRKGDGKGDGKGSGKGDGKGDGGGGDGGGAASSGASSSGALRPTPPSFPPPPRAMQAMAKPMPRHPEASSQSPFILSL